MHIGDAQQVVNEGGNYPWQEGNDIFVTVASAFEDTAVREMVLHSQRSWIQGSAHGKGR